MRHHFSSIQPIHFTPILDNKSSNCYEEAPRRELTVARYFKARNCHSHPQPGFSHSSSATLRAPSVGQHQLPAPLSLLFTAAVMQMKAQIFIPKNTS